MGLGLRLVLPLKLGCLPRATGLGSSMRSEKHTPESRVTGIVLGDADRGMAAAFGAVSNAGATGAFDDTEVEGARYELPLRLKRRSRPPMGPLVLALALASPTALPSSMLVRVSVGESGLERMEPIQPIFWPQLPLLNRFCACSYDAPSGSDGTRPSE